MNGITREQVDRFKRAVHILTAGVTFPAEDEIEVALLRDVSATLISAWEREQQLRQAIRDFHYTLDLATNFKVTAAEAVGELRHKVRDILEMPYHPGKELATRRATEPAGGEEV